ncbi:glycosyltransferase involved in cell wall biosynthesis [Limimaricola soesokkakensis]|uniref:Glycosyl transferases group 1 n=1 Tax=Limimaricola soesokkakensis TaxID=1343159 RepID=A0A1X6YPG0_9RHOB|nr:glycosyltransferase [Limimaricola soesokkakensis]PSK88326.1 glycosyltransferase involved in cell wall biosynthesis [Limimaricola soesokkakensis]SLN26714.1 Glycosyl transferases group 1 [Limimaricola soesokkakensis]
MGAPRALVLDLTRLASRAGRTRTGVDRVERAWLDACLAEARPVFGLLRSPIGFLLLDRAGLARFAAASDTDEWGAAGRVASLFRRLDPPRRAAQGHVRRHAIARSTRPGLERMLRHHLPPGALYLNTGHADLDDRVMRAMRGAGARIAVLLHDTIPLDLPWAARPGIAEGFAAKLDVVARHADRVIVTARTTAAPVTAHLARRGCLPEIVVAPLGVTSARPDPTTLPPGLDLEAPFMVVLGTIEPRKNHALLLDVWERLGPQAPRLLICGARGWNNADVFARLDRGVAGVTELPGLSDPAIAALLERARALLFPSLAEGYGLPPLEALALGCPVICGDLAICRELLGDRAVYCDPTDRYRWERAVRAQAAISETPPRLAPPSWEAHVARALDGL